jgi:hypothetical protein
MRTSIEHDARPFDLDSKQLVIRAAAAIVPNHRWVELSEPHNYLEGVSDRAIWRTVQKGKIRSRPNDKRQLLYHVRDLLNYKPKPWGNAQDCIQASAARQRGEPQETDSDQAPAAEPEPAAIPEGDSFLARELARRSRRR